MLRYLMTYIITALLAEASPIITHFALEKCEDKIFSIYENESIKLIVSGIGKVNAASATTYLLQKQQVKKEDKIVNIGTCTTTKETIMIGALHNICKIVDFATSSVYHLNTQGEAITCVDKPLESNKGIKTPLADMESSGFYLAAKRFSKHAPIMIVKVVSDKTDSTLPKSEDIKALFAPHLKTMGTLLS